METVVDVWPGNNRNVDVMVNMDTEEVCVLDGDRVVDVSLYKGELVLGWRKIWKCGEIEIMVCHVTDIMATTEYHVLSCHM